MTEKQKQAISILNKVRDCMKEKLTEEEYFALLYFIVADVQVHVNYPYPQPITPIYTDTTGDNLRKHENTITSDYAEKIPHEQMEGTSDVASSDYIDSDDEEISYHWEDYERVIKQVREHAECFTGSQNKPRTKKAYNT